MRCCVRKWRDKKISRGIDSIEPVNRKQDSQEDAGIIGDAAQGRRLGLQG